MLRRILVSQSQGWRADLAGFLALWPVSGRRGAAVPLHDGAPTTFGLALAALAADRIESFSMRNPPGAPITRGLRR